MPPAKILVVDDEEIVLLSCERVLTEEGYEVHTRLNGQEALGVTKSEVCGVLTFYNRFHLTPRGKHTLRACRGTAFHFKGAPSIIDSIKSHLKLGSGEETTEDFFFSLEEVACLGAFGISPVMTIDEETYGNLTPGMALEVIGRYEAAERAPAEVPEAAVETVLTSLRYFRGEYERHLKQSCPAHYCKDLTPSADRPLKIAA